MLLSQYERLLKSMVTAHIPHLYCWSLPSRATLFFKIIYAFWKSISFHPRYIATLSYSKLLCTIIACLQLAIHYIYHDSDFDGSINAVWAIDGNYSYGRYPQIFLLLAAIACFILLWILYTLLFTMQWLRSVDHLGPLKFIARNKPLYNAYFAPLTDKHHALSLLVWITTACPRCIAFNYFPHTAYPTRNQCSAFAFYFNISSLLCKQCAAIQKSVHCVIREPLRIHD